MGRVGVAILVPVIPFRAWSFLWGVKSVNNHREEVQERREERSGVEKRVWISGGIVRSEE